MNDLQNQLPPASIEAEEAILGGILFDPTAISKIETNLKIEAFYVKAHQEIYRTALSLFRRGKPTDFISISTYLSDRDLLKQVGGTAKLAQLLDRTVSATNIDRYVELVKDKYTRRQLITCGHEIIDLGYDNVAELENVLNDSQTTDCGFLVCLRENIEHPNQIEDQRSYKTLF